LIRLLKGSYIPDVQADVAGPARTAGWDIARPTGTAAVRGVKVAADSGYADQSHLHRDVRAFTAAAPSASVGAPWLAVDDTAWPTRPRRLGAGNRNQATAGRHPDSQVGPELTSS